MFKTAVSVLHVASSSAAEGFYCGPLGFQRQFVYRPNEALADPCYFGVRRDEVWLHLSSFSGDAVAGGVVNLYVDNVDELFQELDAQGVEVATPPTDQSWGTREMYVRDPDGNCLRFVQCAPSRAR